MNLKNLFTGLGICYDPKTFKIVEYLVNKYQVDIDDVVNLVCDMDGIMSYIEELPMSLIDVIVSVQNFEWFDGCWASDYLEYRYQDCTLRWYNYKSIQEAIDDGEMSVECVKFLNDMLDDFNEFINSMNLSTTQSTVPCNRIYDRKKILCSK